mmetsp:Transcript_6502/g.15634  ORF Transcript_6502/g.15634 Transcript_6502/m.15634 type:complete len:299 (+) Transcript_6502:116-1012(+)
MFAFEIRYGASLAVKTTGDRFLKSSIPPGKCCREKISRRGFKRCQLWIAGFGENRVSEAVRLKQVISGLDFVALIEAWRQYSSFGSSSPRLNHSMSFEYTVAPTRKLKDDFSGNTSEDLREWLQLFGLDTSVFGEGPAKSIPELFEEVVEGESTLLATDNGPLRVVHVLNVFVENDRGETLMEEFQVRPGGSVRSRGLPLSEKLKAGEHWKPAVHRAVAEELGSVLTSPIEVSVSESSYRLDRETRNSNSYPGLRSEYYCHRVRAKVNGLPQTRRFVSYEKRPDGILENHWIWQKDPV